MTNDISSEIRALFGNRSDGQYRHTCPVCSHTRRRSNQRQRCLSVKVIENDIRWLCHHCGENGGTMREEKQDNIVKFKPPIEKIEDAAVTYLKKRGLSEEVISSGRVLSASKWLRKAGKE